ncbi:752_t:CDS:2, partial [Scutellospora calospora]
RDYLSNQYGQYDQNNFIDIRGSKKQILHASKPISSITNPSSRSTHINMKDDIKFKKLPVDYRPKSTNKNLTMFYHQLKEFVESILLYGIPYDEEMMKINLNIQKRYISAKNCSVLIHDSMYKLLDISTNLLKYYQNIIRIEVPTILDKLAYENVRQFLKKSSKKELEKSGKTQKAIELTSMICEARAKSVIKSILENRSDCIVEITNLFNNINITENEEIKYIKFQRIEEQKKEFEIQRQREFEIQRQKEEEFLRQQEENQRLQNNILN